MWADDFATPTVLLEKGAGGFLVGEALKKLIQADGFGLVGHKPT